MVAERPESYCILLMFSNLRAGRRAVARQTPGKGHIFSGFCRAQAGKPMGNVLSICSTSVGVGVPADVCFTVDRESVVKTRWRSDRASTTYPILMNIQHFLYVFIFQQMVSYFCSYFSWHVSL